MINFLDADIQGAEGVRRKCLRGRPHHARNCPAMFTACFPFWRNVPLVLVVTLQFVLSHEFHDVDCRYIRKVLPDSLVVDPPSPRLCLMQMCIPSSQFADSLTTFRDRLCKPDGSLRGVVQARSIVACLGKPSGDGSEDYWEARQRV